MRTFAALTVVLLCGTALGSPVHIDLGPERRAYEAKAYPRYFGLGLLAGSVALGLTSVYGFSQASAVRADLLAQRTPVDLASRQALVSQGEGANALGIGGALLGIGAAIGSAYFLSVSF